MKKIKNFDNDKFTNKFVEPIDELDSELLPVCGQEVLDMMRPWSYTPPSKSQPGYEACKMLEEAFKKKEV